MQVVACGSCGAKNRVDEGRLANGEAKCGRCGTKLAAGAQESKPVIITDQTFEREVLQARGRADLGPACGRISRALSNC
jgi:ribosomal protein L37AE/L43A